MKNHTQLPLAFVKAVNSYSNLPTKNEQQRLFKAESLADLAKEYKDELDDFEKLFFTGNYNIIETLDFEIEEQDKIITAFAEIFSFRNNPQNHITLLVEPKNDQGLGSYFEIFTSKAKKISATLEPSVTSLDPNLICQSVRLSLSYQNFDNPYFETRCATKSATSVDGLFQ